MHTEQYCIDEEAAEKINRAKQEGKQALSRSVPHPAECWNPVPWKTEESFHVAVTSDIFIYPGYKFKMVDAIITNFHLPQSTLIMLVSAFAGKENTMNAYKEAIEQCYRFYSFGDAMFIAERDKR